ncbi:hypothetical protein K7N18_05085 [Burkholderia arboris]|uniref:hypothetical protein n=1 Tax=Burkholderia arboris TaxID=488730 RepID=UPI001CA3A400|nr:hypothetical protein [Burkholderia arboris]MBY8604201.1 hypothetical protein [Burkholderia arboris]
MGDDAWFRFVSISYFVAASLAAICTIISIIAGVAQYRISNKISDEKDRALAEYKVQSETKLALVNNEAAAANKRAGEADQKAAELNRETAVLNNKAAHLEADNLRLKQQLTWRELDKQQIDALVAALRKSPTIKVALVSILGDPEGDNYLEQFAQVFRQANLDIDNYTFQSAFTPRIPIGLSILINPDDRGNQSVIDMAIVLGNALESAEIANPRKLNWGPIVPRGHVAIVIGAKPSFGQHVEN